MKTDNGVQLQPDNVNTTNTHTPIDSETLLD